MLAQSPPDAVIDLYLSICLKKQTPQSTQQSISRLDSELSNKRQRKDKAGAPAATNGKPASPQKSGNVKQATKQDGGRPGLNRAKSNGGGKPASAKGGAAKSAPPALSPEEEEKRRKRAERFNAAS